VTIPRTITPADSAAVRAHAVELRSEILKGAKFEDVAKRESADSSSAVEGGSLGRVTKGRFVKEFEDAAFALKPGEISDVVETQFGFHIIKLDERRTQAGANGQAAEEVHAHHILIAYGTPSGQRSGAPQSPREQARAAVEQEKQDKLIAELVSRAHVNLPADFDAGIKPPTTSAPAAGAATKTPAQSSAPTKRTRGQSTKRRPGRRP
jgi:hypothetical protein